MFKIYNIKNIVILLLILLVIYFVCNCFNNREGFFVKEGKKHMRQKKREAVTTYNKIKDNISNTKRNLNKKIKNVTGFKNIL